MARKSRGVYVMIISVLIFAIFMVVLELNKNTILGWILALAVYAGFFIFYRMFLKERGFVLRAGSVAILIVIFAGILFISMPPIKSVPAVAYKNPKITEEVTVSQGKVTGVYTEDEKVEVFAGIPYAKAPIGELRWKEPQNPDNWEGVLRADTFAPMSMQPRNLPILDSLTQIIGFHDYKISLKDNYIRPMSEDSLYLNIWKPANIENEEINENGLPVLVYIHGGSLQTGQPWYEDYSGEGLARKGVIVVNMGYRLGIFGFHASDELSAESINGTTGNYGLLDQIKALEWVRDNIAAFGGNPDNVTLAGESAGSVCVSALCTSPLAKGLFVRAIGESSGASAPMPGHSYRSLEEAKETGRKIEAELNVSSVDELRALSDKELVKYANEDHHITVDGYVLEKSPYEVYLAGENNEQALLNGFNGAEAEAFLIGANTKKNGFEDRMEESFGDFASEILKLYPVSDDKESYRANADIYSALWFSYGHYCWTRQVKAQGLPVYEYIFTKKNGRLSDWHGGEMIYCYGNVSKNSLYNESDVRLSDIMSEYWANFAKYGNPNGKAGEQSVLGSGEELPLWNEATDGTKVFELGENIGEITDPYLRLHQLFDIHQDFKVKE